MRKFLVALTLLSAASLSHAEPLTAEVNKVAYDYAVAMFKAADVTVHACPASQRERTGFFYLCGKTPLQGDAFEAAWTPASAEYGATDAAGETVKADAWGSTGSGKRGLEVYVAGEFMIGEYGPYGDVSVQSGKSY